MIRNFLTVWFIICTWIAPVTEHAQAWDAFVGDALIASIVLAYSFDALQDGIAFTKSPRGQDLRHLWHAAKYSHIVFTFTAGALNVLSVQKYGWKKTLLFDAVGFVIGVLVWKTTYPMWRRVNWGRIA